MNYELFERPLFYLGDHYVSALGLLAFAGLFAIGLILARFLQSAIVRRLLSRLKLDTNFIAVVTTILSLAALVFFTERDQLRGNSSGLERAAPRGPSEPAQHLPPRRPARGRLLVLLPDEAFSLQPLPR